MPDGYTSGGKPVSNYWINQIQAGKKFRRTYAREDEWSTWRKWYRGEWNPGILPSNVYYKMMRTLIPRVYYRNPSVSLTPSKPGEDNMLLCKLLQRADNKLIDLLGVKEQMKRAVQHGCMFGTGGLRLGFGAEFTPTPEDLATSDPDVGGRRLSKRVEYNDLIQPDMPWILAAHPGQVVVPNGCSDIHSARWVCFEDVRPADDVKEDPRFDKSTRDLITSGVSGFGPQEAHMLARRTSMSERDRSGVLLWEIRDKKTGCVFVMAPNAGGGDTNKILFFDQDDLQVNRHLPFYPLIFNHDDEVFWGVPDSQIIAPQQGEKNEIRTQLRNHRRVAIAKILVESGQITPDEASKLIDGNANGIVQVKNINAVVELNMAAVANVMVALEREDQLIDNEVQQLLGLGVNQFGEYAPGSADRSATEANIVNQATMIRVDERRDACADVLVDIVGDMNHIILERWNQDQVIDLVGPTGIQVWIAVRPEALRAARYDVKVDPDTSLPQTKQLREQKAIQTYGILKGNPLIQPEHLTQFLVSEMYGVDADWLLKSPLGQTTQQQPMPLNQALAALQGAPGGIAAALQHLRPAA